MIRTDWSQDVTTELTDPLHICRLRADVQYDIDQLIVDQEDF